METVIPIFMAFVAGLVAQCILCGLTGHRRPKCSDIDPRLLEIFRAQNALYREVMLAYKGLDQETRDRLGRLEDRALFKELPDEWNGFDTPPKGDGPANGVIGIRNTPEPKKRRRK